jgi:peptidoglycan-associated lipoprotein
VRARTSARALCHAGALVGIAAAMLMFGCSLDEVKQSQFDIEQREQIERENAAKEARVRQEQAELARIREQRLMRDEKAWPIAQTQDPPIQAPKLDNIEQQPLADSQPSRDDALNVERRAVYYDYDSYNVKDQYHSVVEAHARFLLEHPNAQLRIEGHCDERGSREYNLALGQRRADSVKRALNLLGVPLRQIQAVSLGSEKPKALEHDEKAYTENRRSDLIYVELKRASR